MAGEGRDGMEELIPENSTLARRIRAAASKGTLSHAAILSGSGDRMAAARYFAAALECEGEGERPCLRCRQCRKVLEDKGHISHDDAVKKVGGIYAEFRKKQDAAYISEFDRETAKYLKGGDPT